MKKLLLLISMTIAFQNLTGQTCISNSDGLWNDAATWSCGRVPGAGDAIEIRHRVSVEATLNASSTQVVIKNGGNLALKGQLQLGTNVASCNSSLLVEDGGKVTAIGNGQNERLFLCGTLILTGKTSGNLQGGISIGSGFLGPAAFDRGGATTLPVKVLYFEGSIKNNLVKLDWATSNEENFDFFTIERSKDALQFDEIGTIDGGGNSSKILNYSFSDLNPPTGRTYYRLKATDYDGSVEYHGTTTIVNEANTGFSIFPNPMTGSEFNVITNLQPGSAGKISVYNSVGKEVFNTDLIEPHGKLDTGFRLDPGLYIVLLETEKNKMQSRLTVK